MRWRPDKGIGGNAGEGEICGLRRQGGDREAQAYGQGQRKRQDFLFHVISSFLQNFRRMEPRAEEDKSFAVRGTRREHKSGAEFQKTQHRIKSCVHTAATPTPPLKSPADCRSYVTSSSCNSLCWKLQAGIRCFLRKCLFFEGRPR